jgi:iron(III) transport system ATP-binding protein
MFAIENLHKTFQAGPAEVRAIDGISLNVEPGKLITLLGPSGCGKTTTLRCLAGLERPDSGRIVIDGKVVFDSDKRIFVPANERSLGMVFQSYAIWPHMTVFENVAFPLRVARDRKYSAAEVRQEVSRVLEMVQLAGYENRASTRLSGGQQQRLAFARGLVRKPNLLLLDEPLSNLDAKLREQMRVELKRLQRSLGVTTVYVTHDQSEALALSDKIAVFSAGRIVQQGTPQEIYRRPGSQFVADFVGSANFFHGTVAGQGDDTATATVDTPHGTIRCRFSDQVQPGQAVVVTARPEDLVISEKHPGDGLNVFAGKVAHRVFLGEVTDYFVDLGEGREIRVRAAPEIDFAIGRPVHVGIAPQRCVGLSS